MDASALPPGWSKAAFVSRQTVLDNLRALAARHAGAELVLDLSADAWGHGLLDAAGAAAEAGIRTLAVATQGEAQLIKRSGFPVETVVWGTVEDAAMPSSLPRRVATARDLAAAVATGTGELWLDLGVRPGDTSFRDDELETVVGLLSAAAPVRVVLCSASPGRAEVWGARLRTAGVPVGAALSRSLADAATNAAGRGMVRIGAEAFGLSETRDPAPAVVHQALSLRAPVIALKRAPAEVGVSYGYTYRTSAATTLALVPVGYGDGVDRSLGNRASVLLGGTRYTIAGRVAMDATVLDIGAAPISIGELAEFFGDARGGAPSAEDYAQLLGMTSAALVAGLTARVGRVWI